MDLDSMLFKNMIQVQPNEELLEAASKGNLTDVNFLMEQGIDVNVKNSFNYTALILSATNGHTQVVEALLKAGAEVNAANVYSETALLFAVKNDHVDIVKILIQAKANVDVTDIQGHSPLSYACVREDREIAFYLLNALSERNVSPKFEHAFFNEYHKIKKDIFIAAWTMNLRMGQPNLKALKTLKDNNLIINTLLSLQPEGIPQDVYIKLINHVMALITEIKNKPHNKETETQKERVAPVILSNGHKPKRKRRRRAKAMNTTIDSKNLFSCKSFLSKK
jgi:ankyrin repeat protein